MAIFSIISNNLEYKLLDDFQHGAYLSQELAEAEATASDNRQQIAGGIYLITFIITGTMILRWIYLANQNVRELGAENLEYTPGWSVGYFFIPILSLWKPYQAMKQLWQASQSPADWQNQSTPGLLSIWWTLWLVGNALGQVIFRLANRAEEIEQFIMLNIINHISDVIDILLAIALMQVVKNISEMQQRLQPNTENNIPIYYASK
ncbi:DUF4328 domain-containing protein [Paraferrimonas sp. SM1919]|uniref:DUF4328 domain-containing protein n=1 Tax=Paraferrimonas sp. SM1919 TaxID=2662263 RepID=UPI0013D7C064|nr:DUF4328 domain-containing protein [Paraferrimonas sp. SM1919]